MTQSTFDPRYFEDLNDAKAWRQELIDNGSNLCEISECGEHHQSYCGVCPTCVEYAYNDDTRPKTLEFWYENAWSGSMLDEI